MEKQLIREFSRISRQKFCHLESQDFPVAGQGRARLDLDQRLLVVLEVESQGPESETRIRSTVNKALCRCSAGAHLKKKKTHEEEF